MDAKTKSIVIGLISAFAAVMIIIMLFFTISGINGSGSDNKAQSGNKDKSEVVSIDSDGNRVIIIDDVQNVPTHIVLSLPACPDDGKATGRL